MAKQRMVSTRFWSDNFIVNLDIIERYVFLYLLTNEHTNMCGIYEIPLRVMSRETGIDEKELQRLLENRFQEKVFYVDGWIYVKNFSKHQSSNTNMKKGAERELSEVPENIIANINEKIKGFERVRKGSKGFESLSDYTKVEQNSTQHNVTERNLTENFSDTPGETSSPIMKSTSSVFETNTNRSGGQSNGEDVLVVPAKKKQVKGPRILATVTDEEKAQIPMVIEMFVNVLGNKAVKYGDVWQRAAVLELLRRLGFEAVKSAAHYAFSIRGKEYSPSITTPVELRNKYEKLVEYKVRNAPIEVKSRAGLVSEETMLEQELLDRVMNSIRKK